MSDLIVIILAIALLFMLLVYGLLSVLDWFAQTAKDALGGYL